jgi:hypothetical protein
MNTAIVHQHRPVLPVLSLLVAGAAASLAAIAIVTDDVGLITTPVPSRVVESPDVAPAPLPFVAAPAGAGELGFDCGVARVGEIERC